MSRMVSNFRERRSGFAATNRLGGSVKVGDLLGIKFNTFRAWEDRGRLPGSAIIAMLKIAEARRIRLKAVDFEYDENLRGT